VLTGALNPARFQGSDAVFNIGCAVAAVQTLPDGVYIAMNGRVTPPRCARTATPTASNKSEQPPPTGMKEGPTLARRAFAFPIAASVRRRGSYCTVRVMSSSTNEVCSEESSVPVNLITTD
jgi:hypothetical protein